MIVLPSSSSSGSRTKYPCFNHSIFPFIAPKHMDNRMNCNFKKLVHKMCTKYYMESVYIHTTYHEVLLEECNHHQIPCAGFSNIVIILIGQATYGHWEIKHVSIIIKISSILNYMYLNISQYQTQNLHQH